MKAKTIVLTTFILLVVGIFTQFLLSSESQSDTSDGFSDYNGYLTKVADLVIFRSCNGDISYHTLIPTENIDKTLIIDQPTYVNIRAKLSNSVSQIDKINIAKEEKCEGNIDAIYLKNIFTALREVTEDQTLIEDGKNFKSSETTVVDCPECLNYTYEFDHYSVPELHYKTELLIKNGVVIDKR